MKFPPLLTASIASRLLAPWSRPLLATLAVSGLALTLAPHEAAYALRRSVSLALINGLPFDEASEAAIIESFAGRLETV